MKRPSAVPSTQDQGDPDTLRLLGSQYPSLMAHMADTTWDDGKAREVSTLTIRVELGRLNLALNDREAKASAYVTADALEAGLACLESGLDNGTLDWRVWSKARKK